MSSWGHRERAQRPPILVDEVLRLELAVGARRPPLLAAALELQPRGLILAQREQTHLHAARRRLAQRVLPPLRALLLRVELLALERCEVDLLLGLCRLVLRSHLSEIARRLSSASRRLGKVRERSEVTSQQRTGE